MGTTVRTITLALVAGLLVGVLDVGTTFAHATKRSSLLATLATADTDTLSPADISFGAAVGFAEISVAEAQSPDPPIARQAWAKGVGIPAWLGYVRTHAKKTGAAGNSAGNPSEEAIAELEVTEANLVGDVLTITLDGTLTKSDPNQRANLEFMCYILEDPETLGEGPPPTQVLKSGLVSMATGSFSHTTAGIFNQQPSLINDIPGGVSISGDVECEIPSEYTGEQVVVSLASDAVGEDVVGGIAELPDAARTPLESTDSSGMGVLAGIVTVSVLAGSLVLGGAAWHARRQRAR